MRSTIANNGIYNPLTTKLGKTEAEQRAADAELNQERREAAAQNLVRFAQSPEDYLLLADMLGLTDVIPEGVQDELRAS